MKKIFTLAVLTMLAAVAQADDLTFKVGLANINAHIPELSRLIEKGILNPRPLISHIMPLSDAAKGYEIFNARKDNVMKVLLKP